MGVVPGPLLPCPGYTTVLPPLSTTDQHPVAAPTSGRRDREAQKPPAAWVKSPVYTTLPKVVTVLRGFSTGKTGREGAESGNVWIAEGQNGP